MDFCTVAYRGYRGHLVQENAEQAVREMLQQFSHDRGLPEVFLSSGHS
jgi:hypothetical protein